MCAQCFVHRGAFPLARRPQDARSSWLRLVLAIAPMRAFIEDRNRHRRCTARRRKENFGPAVLYFGFRDFEEDYLYRDELAQAQAAGVVSVSGGGLPASAARRQTRARGRAHLGGPG